MALMTIDVAISVLEPSIAISGRSSQTFKSGTGLGFLETSAIDISSGGTGCTEHPKTSGFRTRHDIK